MELVHGDKIGFYCSNVGLACRIGDLQRLSELLANGAPVDNPDNRGWFPIHEAAFGNHVDCLNALFDRQRENINVNWRSHDGSTALLLASQRGHLETIQLLLSQRADPDLGSTDDLKPLLAATKSGSIRCVETLLDAGADVSGQYWNKYTALHEAVSQGYDHIVRLLLARNADPFASDDEGLTGAFVACQYGHSECLQLLVDAVKDKTGLVNSRTNDGSSCVYVAAQEGNFSCLEILIRNGADVNICTKSNIHPICAAAKRNYTRCARLMLPVVDKDVLFYSAEDPVFVAVEEHRLDMLTLLLKSGLPHNRLTEYFRDFAVPIYRYLQPLLTKTAATPLACAVARVDLESAKLLLRHKAETVSTNGRAYSPLLLAILKRRMPELLLEILKANPALNTVSVHSVCRVPDAVLVAAHPLYRGQLVAMLKAGLNPSLLYWCLCKQPADVGSANYSFLRELSGILLPGELADQLRVILPFSSCGIPNCCQAWATALGPRMVDFEDWQRHPLSLQQICRIAIRARVMVGQLASDQWTDSLSCSPVTKDFLRYKFLVE